MFTALGLMLLGMVLGRLLRGQGWLGLLTRSISPVIMLMLFCLGVAVGSNDVLMSNLPLLGGKAFLLTFAGLAGSLLAVALIRRWIDAPRTPGIAPVADAAASSGKGDGQES